MSFLRPPTAGAADRETLINLKWILGQMTVLTLFPLRPASVGSFCPSRFRNGSMECPGSAKQRLEPSRCVRMGSTGRHPALIQGLRFDWRRVRDWYQTSHPVWGFISPITLWLGKAGWGQQFAANLDATKVGTNWSVIHSAMEAAKSIPSPIRCLTSLSHARGLVP